MLMAEQPTAIAGGGEDEFDDLEDDKVEVAQGQYLSLSCV